MLKVYKYDIPVADEFSLTIKRGAMLLTFAWQASEFGEGFKLWALVEPDEMEATRRFRMSGTGHDIQQAASELGYIGTAFHPTGVVTHLFEIKSAG